MAGTTLLRCAQLLAFGVCMSVILPCCQNALKNVEREQQAKAAVMQEKEQAILAECELKRLHGVLKTYAASTQCSNPVIIQAHQEAGDPAMDLVYLLTAYRLAVAERIDKGRLREAEGNLMVAQLVSRINTERLQRDMATLQRKPRTAELYSSLLKGLGTWQSSETPPAHGETPLPSQPSQPSPISCYPDGSRMIICK